MNCARVYKYKIPVFTPQRTQYSPLQGPGRLYPS